MLIIVEGGRERSDPDRNAYKGLYTPAVNPNPYDPFVPLAAWPGVRAYVNSQSYGIGFVDTIKLRPWLLLSGGVRFDYFNTHSYSAANPLAVPATAAYDVSRLDKQPDYRAAIVVKPRPQGSFYFDYGTSFNPSAESLSLSANNAAFPPELNTTYELGGKWEYLHQRLNISASAFQTEKDNAHETDPNNSNNTLIAGTYMVKGGQIGAIGHLPKDFDLILGYAYLDAYLENSGLNASPFNAINAAMYTAWQTALHTNPAATPIRATGRRRITSTRTAFPLPMRRATAGTSGSRTASSRALWADSAATM